MPGVRAWRVPMAPRITSGSVEMCCMPSGASRKKKVSKAEIAVARTMPWTSQRFPSSSLPAPWAWATTVSRPRRMPPRPNATVLKRIWASATADMATAAPGRRPTIMVSMRPMSIHPISAATRGMAMRSMGRSSWRSCMVCGGPLPLPLGKILQAWNLARRFNVKSSPY